MQSVSDVMAVTGLMDEPEKSYRKDIPERILRGNVRFFRKFLRKFVDNVGSDEASQGAKDSASKLIEGWQAELRRRGLAEERLPN